MVRRLKRFIEAISDDRELTYYISIIVVIQSVFLAFLIIIIFQLNKYGFFSSEAKDLIELRQEIKELKQEINESYE